MRKGRSAKRRSDHVLHTDRVGPVILGPAANLKAGALYFFLIHIENLYVNMMLLKIKKIIITEIRIIIGIRALWDILHVK
jgi:hypothetical protein